MQTKVVESIPMLVTSLKKFLLGLFCTLVLNNTSLLRKLLMRSVNTVWLVLEKWSVPFSRKKYT